MRDAYLNVDTNYSVSCCIVLIVPGHLNLKIYNWQSVHLFNKVFSATNVTETWRIMIELSSVRFSVNTNPSPLLLWVGNVHL